MSKRESKKDIYALYGIIAVASTLSLTALSISTIRRFLLARRVEAACREVDRRDESTKRAIARLPSLESKTEMEKQVDSYRFLPNVDIGIYSNWRNDLSEYLALFKFLNRNLRYVATVRNNESATIDNYARDSARLRASFRHDAGTRHRRSRPGQTHAHLRSV